MPTRAMILASLFSLGLGSCPVSAQASENLVLAENGASSYRIVIAENASPSIRHAAEELQTFLRQMTGATLPIVADREPLGEREILLGDSARLAQAGIAVEISALGVEGYHLKTVGRRLLIAGSARRGALYGVYGLLEDHWGCRWFTPEVSHIPRHARLEIGPLDDRQIPALEYRDVFLTECFDADWCARNRLNSHAARLDAKHGGKVVWGDGWFVHTFYRIAPPSKYFDSHPEYFSLVRGKRLHDDRYGQLCCTNEDVIRLCTREVLAAMRAQPSARYFSVSQSDTFPSTPNYCECENCRKLAEAEGSQMAPVLMLVNRVAEAVAREFPDNVIETLAYRWTRKPPKSLRPRKNVIVRLCTAECCFSHPLATCDYVECRRFRDELAAWSKTGARLWIWNYNTSFAHYLLPFPNQQLHGENMRFFVKNRVKGVFQQDAHNTPGSELAALGGYVMAKHLWNPDHNNATAIKEFLAAYYGPAAGSVWTYLAILHDCVRTENVHLGIDPAIPAQPSSRHLSDAFLLKANALWQEAETQASVDAATLRRVQVSRLCVDYAIVERARLQVAGKLPASAELKSLAIKRFGSFAATLERAGVQHLCEWEPFSLVAYRTGLQAGLGIPAASPRADAP